ncbi:MAG: pitrilysin family protein [Pseudomonadota bacterium]
MILRSAAAALALTASTFAAAEPAITTFTLDNGLQAVVIEDHRAPVVTHMVWYPIGSADEPAGKSGIAHFLEHLMFKGTDEIPEGAFSKIIAANGGTDNAFTSYDYTGYFQRIAADRLGLVMKMEADRMRDLVITDALADTERDVVLEERNQRVDNNPGSLLGEQMNAMLYRNHRYGVPIVGWQHEIESLTRDDAMDFYARHYAPDNAYLIVAGDVTPEEVERLAIEHYGPLEAAGRPPEVRPQEPPSLTPRRIALEDERVRQPYIVRYYLAPTRGTGDTETAAALSVLAQILGDGITSRFAQAMEAGDKTAISTGAWYSAKSRDPSSFGIYAVPGAEVELATVEAGLDAVLATLKEEGPTEAELARVKRLMRAAMIYAQDSQSSLARRYGSGLVIGLSVEDIQNWPAMIEAVTAEDVRQAARTYLTLERSVTGWLERKETEEEQG